MKRTLIGLSIIAALSPAIVSAQSYDDTSQFQSNEKKGGYIGASFGQTELDVSSEDKEFISSYGGSVDDTDTGIKIFGGYRINDYFAIEVFYADLGEVSADFAAQNYSLTMEADTIGISGVGIIPLNENFELFAKIGINSWDATMKDSDGLSLDDDGSDPMYGIGAAYTYRQVSFRLEYELYELDEEDVDMFSFGVAYNF